MLHPQSSILASLREQRQPGGNSLHRRLPIRNLQLLFGAPIAQLDRAAGLIADYLRGNTLAAVCILPKRYAELERNAIYVSSIIITKPVDK